MSVPQAPDEFVCPLTLDVMNDPVMDAHGHNFEKAAIMAWIHKGNATCPLTRQILQPKDLISNSDLRMKIGDWRRNHDPFVAEEQELRNENARSNSQDNLDLDSKSTQTTAETSRRTRSSERTRPTTRSMRTARPTNEGGNTEAMAEAYLLSLSTEQLEAINVVCDIHTGDVGMVFKRMLKSRARQKEKVFIKSERSFDAELLRCTSRDAS